MKLQICLIFLLLSNLSFSEEALKFWCRSEPVPSNGNYFIRTGNTLEETKNLSRSKCQEKVQKKCQVLECGQGTHPFAFTCVAAKMAEYKIGGFFAYGKNPSELWKVAYNRCWSWDWGIDRKFSCQVVCFPSDIKDEN